MSETALVLSVQQKIQETLERTEHLISLVPADHLKWHPAGNFLELGRLLAHIVMSASGFCAVLHRTFPMELAHCAALPQETPDSFCGAPEAIDRLTTYARHIDEGFLLCRDADLSRVLPNLFVPEGLTVLASLLNNLEHLAGHRYQLFMYLKMLGITVASPDIYRFR